MAAVDSKVKRAMQALIYVIHLPQSCSMSAARAEKVLTSRQIAMRAVWHLQRQDTKLQECLVEELVRCLADPSYILMRIDVDQLLQICVDSVS